MTELELRTLYVDTFRSYYGAEQGSAQHKELLDYYNINPNLPRGYRMTVNDPWCAATVSAIGIRLGLEGVVFPECSCGKMIDLYKAAGRWVEADDYVPQPGDLIIYDWDDDGKGDCTGDPEHVGAVVRITDGVIRVIEGNMGNPGKVWHRDIPVNGKYIRGFCCPDYATLATNTDREEETDVKTYNTVQELPEYAQATVQKLVDSGALKGTGEGLGLSEDMARILVILDRMGKL